MTHNSDSQPTCLTCNGTGQSAQGWGGGSSADGSTCLDCRGSGIDRTPYGVGSDHCPHCGADWKRPHSDDCPTQG